MRTINDHRNVLSPYSEKTIQNQEMILNSKRIHRAPRNCFSMSLHSIFPFPLFFKGIRIRVLMFFWIFSGMELEKLAWLFLLNSFRIAEGASGYVRFIFFCFKKSKPATFTLCYLLIPHVCLKD
jgi:hypothetical protein